MHENVHPRSLKEQFLRIIRPGYPHGHPYGCAGKCKLSHGCGMDLDIHTDIFAL